MFTDFFKWLARIFGFQASVPTVPVSPPAPVVSPVPVVPAQPGGLSRFDKAIRYVMENEDGVPWDRDHGCFTNDPRDPGGATCWGIIKTEYEDYLKRPLTIEEVKSMPRDVAISIYKKSFWEPINGSSYSSDAAAIAIMDVAVNKGLGGCMVILRDALSNDFPVRYSNAVIEAVNAQSSPIFLALMRASTDRYIEARIAKYPNMAWARAGWRNRSARMLSLK